MIKNDVLNNIKQYVDMSYLDQLEQKYDLIVKGSSLFKENLNDAIDFFSNLLNHELFKNDYYPYAELAKIYRRLGRNSDEVKILVSFFKSEIYCNSSKFNFFKGRLKELSNEGYFDNDKINSLESEFNLNGAKNWDLSRKPVPPATEVKIEYENMVKVHEKIDMNYFDEFLSFDEHLSYESQMKLKNDFIKKGNEFMDNKNYPCAIAFFNALLNHKLFINDYYPYSRLSQCFRKTKQRLEEIDIIIRFLKSDILCDDEQLHWFNRRLEYHEKYGFINQSKIDELILEFSKKNSLNSNNKEVIDTLSDDDILSNDLEKGEVIDTLSDDDILSNDTNDNYHENVYKNDNEKEKSQESTVLDNSKSHDVNIDSHLNQTNTINKEREQMMKVIELMESGKTQSQAANFLNLPVQKVYKWMHLGRNNTSENTRYFYHEVIRIQNDNENSSIKNNNSNVIKTHNIDESEIFSKPKKDIIQKNESNVDIKEITQFNLENINDEEIRLLVSKFNDYIKNPFYKMDVREFNLSFIDIEHVKNEIYNDILQKKIEDANVNFRDIFITYCKDYFETKNNDQNIDFEILFKEVNTQNYDKLTVQECKLKTIKDYKSNIINLDEIPIRFNYYLKRKILEKNQLDVLEDIKKSSDVPSIKGLLSVEEQNEIYVNVKGLICSDEGLNEDVLDYIRFLMKRKVEKNKSEARKKLSNFLSNKKYFIEITNLNLNQIEGFIKEVELLIDLNQIKYDDINEKRIIKLSSIYLNSGKLFIGVNYGL